VKFLFPTRISEIFSYLVGTTGRPSHSPPRSKGCCCGGGGGEAVTLVLSKYVSAEIKMRQLFSDRQQMCKYRKKGIFKNCELDAQGILLNETVL
jgi:hypothetical protein